MDKLKEVLFKRALNYYDRLTDPAVSDAAAYSFLATYEVIIEAGLDEEFQQYKIENGGKQE